jgi:hypothetical protein
LTSPEIFPCPCCGYLVFANPPGSYELCLICFWEDDLLQLGFPLLAGGANQLSLYDSQQQFVRCGACEERFVKNVRPPLADEQRDETWRLFDPVTDMYLSDVLADGKQWRERQTEACLYYWHYEYWLTGV